MSEQDTDINELMMRDPLSHTSKDIDAIIAVMRERRTRFNLGDASAGAAKPRVPKALQGVSKDVLDMEIKL